TRYPWEGKVKMFLAPDARCDFTLKIRVPGWARNEVVPSDLYHFVPTDIRSTKLKLNDKDAPLDLVNGYVSLNRTWDRNDSVELDLPMPVRRVMANEKVQADHGRVALQRGPIVYCAEWPDNPGGQVRNLLLPDDQPLSAEF